MHQGAAASQATGTLDPVFSYRYDLFQPKPYPRATASAIIRSLSARRQFIRSGEIGLYLGVYPTVANERMIYPVLDVDGEKKDPRSAIERGQALYGVLYDMDLLPYTRFMLSGTGIRVCFTFLLPYELQPGFIEFQRGLTEYGVDPGPYLSTDPPPIRMLCYRGHKKQRNRGDVFLDRHSALIEIEDLMSMESADDYHHFTKGRPNPDQYIDWLATIIPRTCCSPEHRDLPDAVDSFLQRLSDLKIETELRRNVFGDFDLPHASTSRTLSIDNVIQFLEERGIGWTDKHHFIKLGHCPECGRRGKAWMTQWGILKCFSSNCRAWDAGGGLKAAEWVPHEYLKYTDVEEPQKAPLDFVDLLEAEEAIHDHLPKAGNIALAVTPGVGKTRAGLADAARRAEKGVVVYALPTHRLIGECAARAEELLNKRIPILHLWGRRPKGPPTCFNFPRVKEAMAMGYYPSATVCLRCQYGTNRTKENGSDLCPYYKQFETLSRWKRGLVFCTISFLPYLTEGGCNSFDRAYIDEQALPHLLQKEPPIGLDEIQSIMPKLEEIAQRMVERILAAAKALQDTTVKAEGKIARLYSKEPGGGQWKDKIEVWSAARTTKRAARAALAPVLNFLLDLPQLRLYEEEINLRALNWLAATVGESVAWIQVNLKNKARPISFQLLSRARIPETIPLTVLDATASEDELCALFQRRFDLLDLHVDWEGLRIWIRQGMGKGKTQCLDDGQIRKYLKFAVAQLPANCSLALLVTHQGIEERTLKILQELTPGVLWESTHYFASRGLNTFEACSAVLCFGVPTLNPEHTADLACYLFPDDPVRQGEWIRYQSEAELYQCAHRARFVRNPGRTLIVMGQYWPEHLLGKPDQTFDRRRNGSSNGVSERINEAAERAIPILDMLGFFTKEVAAWVGIGAKDHEAKVFGARQAIKELRARVGGLEALQVYQLLYSILIGVDTPELDNLIVFGRRNSWTDLLEELARRRPDVGRLSVKLPNWGNRNWTYALGTIDAAREWENALAGCLREIGFDGRDFNENSWRMGWKEN